MTVRLRAIACLFAVWLAIDWTSSSAAQTQADLKRHFLNPPPESRPMVRWWWFGVAVTKPEILRELQQMRADNIGGAELAFVYPEAVNDSAKGIRNLPFLSPEMLDCVRYAQEQGRRLGLRIDVTLGSGWPYGGPATALNEAASRLRVVEVPVAANSAVVAPPTLAQGETFISAVIADAVEPRDTDASASDRPWSAGSAKALSPEAIALPAALMPRIAVYFIAGRTGQVVKRAAAGAEGWVLDPFSHEAVATHLSAVGGPLLRAFGDTPPYAVFSDSLEAYGADWTPNLPAEFKRRRGYDLVPRLPELVAGGTPSAMNVRHDWGTTLTELVDENYVAQIEEWARSHHTKFRSQTYGEPAVSFSSQRLVDLPEGEGSRWRQFSTLRWATSANHVFGNTISSGESFTWLHSPVFRATPLDMKAEADVDFLSGQNLFIYHGWPYSPAQAGEPGWSLYAAGAFNEHNPWHPVMAEVDRYIQRISFLLCQGRPANQVAILLPTDDAWASFSPGKAWIDGKMNDLVSPTLVSAILSAGYNFDFIDADAIGSPGLGAHSVLVLPPTDRIPATALAKIKSWVAGGGRVISVGREPSIGAEGEDSVASVSHSLFKVDDLTSIPDETQLAKALRHAAKPDLQAASHADDIGFIRRRLPACDIYFIANTTNHPVLTTLTFSTMHKHGERWNPDTGGSTSSAARDQALDLAPYESAVFVFSDAPAHGHLARPYASVTQHRARGETQIADLSAGWQLDFAVSGKTKFESSLTDWTKDPTTMFYSGEVTYSRQFALVSMPVQRVELEIVGGSPVQRPAELEPNRRLLPNGLPDPNVTQTGPGMRAWYDPPVRDAAIVFINGKRAGALWHPPYRLDVTDLLVPGSNRIEMRVYNTALNAWAALPARNYSALVARYGDRFQMQDLDQVHPLPSGILGDARLVTSGTP